VGRNKHRNRQNQPNQPQTTPQGLSSLNPKKQGRQSAIHTIGRGIHWFSGPELQFWGGLGLAGYCIFKNWSFYHGVAYDAFEWPWIQAFVGGGVISLTTTHFELRPIIKKRSSLTALDRVFRIAARPTNLPRIQRGQHHNLNEPIDTYARVEEENDKFDSRMRWACILFEILVGIAFAASLAAGWKGLMQLADFVFSIFGAEWGLAQALRSYDLVLPPAIRAQMDRLLNNNKPLQF
jgi:hypothetical protein